MKNNIILLPKKYRDLIVKYKGQYYWGYYDGNNTWRVGISSDGKADIFVDTNEITWWEYDNYEEWEN